MAAYAAAGLKDIITGLLPGGHSYYSEGGTGSFSGKLMSTPIAIPNRTIDRMDTHFCDPPERSRGAGGRDLLPGGRQERSWGAERGRFAPREGARRVIGVQRELFCSPEGARRVIGVQEGAICSRESARRGPGVQEGRDLLTGGCPERSRGAGGV